MANKSIKRTSDEEIITRVILLPRSHWVALGEHAKVKTGKSDGRSVIIRKLIGRFIRETGALRRMKEQAKRKEEKALAARKARAKSAAAAAKSKAPAKRANGRKSA